MKYILIVTMLILLSFFSCSKIVCGCEPLPPEPAYTALVVEANNIDCNRSLIRIEPIDTARLRLQTGLSGDHFIVDQLTSALQVNNQKIAIAIKAMPPAEDFNCTTLGPAYTHVKTIYAIERF